MISPSLRPEPDSTTLTKDSHLRPRRDSNPPVSAAATPRLDSAATEISPNYYLTYVFVPYDNFNPKQVHVRHPSYGTIHVDYAARFCGKHKTFTHISWSIKLRLIKNSALSSECVPYVCWLHSFLSIERLQVCITRHIFPFHLSTCHIFQCMSVQRYAANGLMSSRCSLRIRCKDIHHVGFQEKALQCWPVADVADTNSRVCRCPKSHYHLHMAPVFWRNGHLLLSFCVGTSRHVLLFGNFCLTDVDMLQTVEVEPRLGRDLWMCFSCRTLETLDVQCLECCNLCPLTLTNIDLRFWQ
jgi:hypothetical protein